MKKRKKIKKIILIFILLILLLIPVGIYSKNLFSKKEEPVVEDKKKDPIKEEIPKEEEPEIVDDPNVKKTSKGFIIEEIDGVTYIDGLLIVNRTYPVPKDYKPKNPHVPISSAGYCMDCIEDDIYKIYEELKNDASKEGIKYWIKSGFRSYAVQKSIFNGKVQKGGQAYADEFSARPGFSEHQTGLCFDLNSTKQSFGETKEGIWLNENCYKYGFIIRYPKGKENETGYQYEPWHLRYVGKELAEKLYNNGDWITLETYFGITSVYATEK